MPSIANVLAPVVDYRAIAKGVMAKYYRRAEPEQFEAFIGVFQDSLVQAYTKALVTFAIDSYSLQKNPGEDGRAGREKVWVKVYADNSVYDIHYTMSSKSGAWKVTNVVLDGVNLGLAFRKQFATAMRQYGNNMDQVIDNWTTGTY
jgi:phospholipid transport system substrate-binding protein